MANIRKFESEGDLKTVLATQYQKTIINYFGDEKKALAFLSGVVSAVQRLPELMDCTAPSVINSFMTMAQLGFMPSNVSGEAYVLPYKKGGVLEAQFQLGYQGLVTLFYRSGVKDITAEIVYEKDKFERINGAIHHTPDFFSDDRGEPKGAYVIIRLPNGGVVSKIMSKSEILEIAQKFSKSYGASFSPWKEGSDPQLWMWKKTVLKQCAKLVPKNETIVHAIAEDNKDSVIQDRLDAAAKESGGLKMGSLLEAGKQEGHEKTTKAKAKKGGGDTATEGGAGEGVGQG